MKYGDRNQCKGLKQVQKCEGLISFVSSHTNSVRKCFLNYGSYNMLSLSHSLPVADLIEDTFSTEFKSNYDEKCKRTEVDVSHHNKSRDNVSSLMAWRRLDINII